MKYKQTTPYGCGMYAVAHACNLDNFVTEKRLEESKAFGNLTCQLDKWMKEDDIKLYMQPLFYDGKAKDIPKHWHDLKIEGEVIAMPLVFCVTLSEGGLSHMIGAHLDKNGILYVYDSLKSDVYESTIDRLNESYHHIFGMFVFCDVNNGDYAFIG